MEGENSEAFIDAPPAEICTMDMESVPTEAEGMEMEITPAADDKFQAMEETAPPQPFYE